MDKNKQNIEIAKLCGWTEKEVIDSSFQNPLNNVSRGLAWHDPRGNKGKLPNYVESIDAMREAWKTLSLNSKDGDGIWSPAEIYVSYLADETGDSVPVFATAEQMAKAFLLVNRKWEE